MALLLLLLLLLPPSMLLLARLDEEACRPSARPAPLDSPKPKGPPRAGKGKEGSMPRGKGRGRDGRKAGSGNSVGPRADPSAREGGVGGGVTLP